MNENVWLITNRKKVDALLRKFEEHRMRGSYGGDINLGEAIMLTRGLIVEIERLNREVEKETDASKLEAIVENQKIEIKQLEQNIANLKGEGDGTSA
jgi:hypothetical protein